MTKAAIPYEVALKSPAFFYDLKLATFGIENKACLIVTFPVLLKSTKSKPLTLFEIETVPVPIDDQDKSVDSVREVLINKPYIAATDSNYIQLWLQALHMCKEIQHDFYCEGTFMVKHAHYPTCEGLLFYNGSASKI